MAALRLLEPVESIKEGAIGEVRLREQTSKRPSVKTSEFFGLWKDREDVEDGLTHTRKLRSRARY